MRGESVEEYWNWWTAFVEGYKPETMSDWLEVNELAHRHWEQRRLRRYGPSLVESALGPALTELLRRHHKGGPEKVSSDYFSQDPAAREGASETHRKYGITDDQILAEAMQKRGDALVVLDKMDNYRATATRLLRKEIDRRFEARKASADKADNQTGVIS